MFIISSFIYLKIKLNSQNLKTFLKYNLAIIIPIGAKPIHATIIKEAFRIHKYTKKSRINFLLQKFKITMCLFLGEQFIGHGEKYRIELNF